MLTLFFASLVTILWVYFGYPVTLRLGIFGRRKAVLRAGMRPSLSVIVPAHNEEATIEAKIRNLLASDYPRELVEILIGSDGSSDRTEAIVRHYESEGVGLISFPQQLGKSAIQNGLVAAASGDILVFTDADCFSSPDALARLVEHFADPAAAIVTARPRYTNAAETITAEHESLYLRYETWLRAEESARGLLAMASGSLFAMRRPLWRPLDRALGDDFVLPLRAAEMGLRTVLDERVAAVTKLSQNRPAALLRMKARIIHKDFRALIRCRALLNPARHGALAFALWSHKLLRWLIPYFLLLLLAANLALLERPFFGALLALQGAFYLSALCGFALGGRGGRLLSIPASFCLVNLAALIGTLKCLAGRSSGSWTPARAPAAGVPSITTSMHELR